MVEVSGSANLKAIFNHYNGTQKTMEGKSFAKLAKDCKLIDKKLTATDVDLIFAKVKDKSERRFHDDKNLYTGVHANGGPTNVDSIHPVASFG